MGVNTELLEVARALADTWPGASASIVREAGRVRCFVRFESGPLEISGESPEDVVEKIRRRACANCANYVYDMFSGGRCRLTGDTVHHMHLCGSWKKI